MGDIIVTTKEALRQIVKEAVYEAIGSVPFALPTESTVKEWMNIQEAAAFLKISANTIYSYTSRNQIPFIKRTRKLMFKRADLEKWLEEKRIESLANFKKSL